MRGKASAASPGPSFPPSAPHQTPTGASAAAPVSRVATLLEAYDAGQLSASAVLRALLRLLSSPCSASVAGKRRGFGRACDRILRGFSVEAEATALEPAKTQNSEKTQKFHKPPKQNEAHAAGTDDPRKARERICVMCAAVDVWLEKAQEFLLLMGTEKNAKSGESGLLTSSLGGRGKHGGNGGVEGSRAAKRRRRKRDRAERESETLALGSAKDDDDEEDEETGEGAERDSRAEGSNVYQQIQALVKHLDALTHAIANRAREEANRDQLCLPTLMSLVRLLHRLALLALFHPSAGLLPSTVVHSAPACLAASSSASLLVEFFPSLRRVLRDSVAAVLDVLALPPPTGAFATVEEERRTELKTACADMLHNVLHQPASLSLFASSLVSLAASLRARGFDLAFDADENVAFYGRAILCRLSWIFRLSSSSASSLSGVSSAAGASPLPAVSGSAAASAKDEKHERLLLSFETVFEQTFAVCDGLRGLWHASLDASAAAERKRQDAPEAHRGRETALTAGDRQVARERDFKRSARAIELLRDLLLFGSGQPIPKEGALGVPLAPFEREGGRYLILNVAPCVDLLLAFLDGALFVFRERAQTYLGRLDEDGSEVDDAEAAVSEEGGQEEAKSEDDRATVASTRPGGKARRDNRDASRGGPQRGGDRGGDRGDGAQGGKNKGKKRRDEERQRKASCRRAESEDEEDERTEDEDAESLSGARDETDSRDALLSATGERDAVRESQVTALIHQYERKGDSTSPDVEHIFTAAVECMQVLLDVAGDAGVTASVDGFASLATRLLQPSSIDLFPSVLAARFSGVMLSFLRSLFTAAPFLFPPLADSAFGWAARVFDALGAPLSLEASASSRRGGEPSLTAFSTLPLLPSSAEASTHRTKTAKRLRLVELCRAIYAFPFFQLGQLTGSQQPAAWGGAAEQSKRRAANTDNARGDDVTSVDGRDKRRKRRRGGAQEASTGGIIFGQGSMLQDEDGLRLLLHIWQDNCRLLAMLIETEASRSLRGELFLTRVRGATDGLCLDILLRLDCLVESWRRSLWMGAFSTGSALPCSAWSAGDDSRLSALVAAVDEVKNCLTLRQAACGPSLRLSQPQGQRGTRIPEKLAAYFWQGASPMSFINEEGQSGSGSSLVGVYEEAMRTRLILGAIEASAEAYRQVRKTAERSAGRPGARREKAPDRGREEETGDEETETEENAGDSHESTAEERHPGVQRADEVDYEREETVRAGDDQAAENREGKEDNGEGSKVGGNEQHETPLSEQHQTESQEEDGQESGISSGPNDEEDAEDSESEEMAALMERIRQAEGNSDNMQRGA
ncbi:hypothetical protein BESB_065540 [Besnoitia besnoiti]|uniref:Uncharacterized protein n=1 Tax=Besnoitia besnoiti TaxID=94643 RepID=A0A2A9MGK3_BESBE|nr:hypothetical protein BESB_065540 [Besnoitia besnoiti]PFH34522.1 hypothetical protein BESB_065540 [Besnoitia besnoiti]